MSMAPVDTLGSQRSREPSRSTRVVVIGIVGGVASGKSHVARQFAALGAAVIDADALGHEVLTDPRVKDALRERWGEAVFDARGEVNRSAVARRVFPAAGRREELEFLESVTHPRIRERMLQRVAAIREAGTSPAIVLDAALLMEAGWDEFCDRIVFVEVPQQQRLQRIAERGWTAADLQARENAQRDLMEKKRQADWVIDNSGTTEHTFDQVQQFWQTLG